MVDDNQVLAALKGLPAAQVKPISGTASVGERMNYLAELVAYAALDGALTALAEEVRTAGTAGVLIVEDRALLQSTWAYERISGTVDSLRGELDRLPEQVREPAAQTSAAATPQSQTKQAGVDSVAGLIGALGALPGLLGVMADVVGMVRSEYATSGRSLSPSATPVVTATHRLLGAAGVTSWIDGFCIARKSKLLERIHGLSEARAKVEEGVVPLREALLLSKIEVDAARAETEALRAAVIKAAASTDIPPKLEEQYRRAEHRLVAAQMDANAKSGLVGKVDQLFVRIDAFLMGISAAADQGGEPPLIGALRREVLFAGDDAAPGTRVSHALFVSVDSIGSDITHAVKRFGRDRYTYLGGVQISYLIIDREPGTEVRSGTLRWAGSARFDPGTGGLTDHRTYPLPPAQPGERAPARSAAATD